METQEFKINSVSKIRSGQKGFEIEIFGLGQKWAFWVGSGDPNGWIYHANQFFNYHQINPHNQVLLVFFYMCKALTWFQDLDAFVEIISWVGFTHNLLIHFDPTLFNDLMEALTLLRQTTIVKAYKTQFEVLYN